MGERKVLNRYIPPDFDPSIIPKSKRDWGALIEVRMMLPFSMKCMRCGNYMYRGKKFNSKKETLQDQTYLGIRIHRFYIKCSVCSNEITFKTDPKNTDYELESGATRNFELWRENEEITEEEKKQREEEDSHDVMKGLENRTLDSKVEMDILDALDEIKAINQRHERVDTNDILKKLNFSTATSAPATTGTSSSSKDGLTAEDEELLQGMRFKQQQAAAASSSSTTATSEKSLADKIQEELKKSSKANSDSQMPIIVKKKRKTDSSTVEVEAEAPPVQKKVAVTSSLAMFNYSDSD
jgi:hypothetical protein